jgi:hypothetical protein
MKKLILALGLVPVIAFSNNADDMQAEMNKVLKKAGLPTPGSGLQVVPNNSIQMPSWQRDKFKSDAKELKLKGYVEQTSERAYELMHFGEQVKRTGYTESPSTNEGDSGLHHSAADIAFSYSYVGVPSGEVIQLYGIAPAGAFLTTPQRGWTGAVAFFKSHFASCAYTEKNIMPGQGGVQVEEAFANYDVNGKLTVIDVQGNDNSGFLYNVSWFDANYYRQLECATESFSKATQNQTIELARKIDIN